MNLNYKMFGLVLVLIIFQGCSRSASEQAVQGANALLQACPGFEATGKPPLVYNAQCGELLVKENPADPASKEISVAILRLPAVNPVPKADPLFLIQGGPGASSIDMAEQIQGYFAEVRKNRDLVFVDQRGTGKSNPLNCTQLTEQEQLLPEAEQEKISLANMEACKNSYGAALEFYTTPYAVMDLESVRAALGYEKINLWGGSYGTRVVLEYMRTHAEHLRAVIMDGVAPPSIALPKYFQTDGLAAFRHINSECLAQSECAELYGDMEQKAKAIVQRLTQLDAQGTPLTVSYENPRYKLTNEFLLTPRKFSMLIFMSLYSRDLSALLPHAIADAANEDYRLLAALYSLSSEQGGNLTISEAMRYTIVCNEDAHFISAADIDQATTFFGGNMLQDFSAVCALWPKYALPQGYFDPVQSDVPALLLSGRHDPVTPVRWAEQVAQTLTQAKLLEAPGGNHSISVEGCVPQIIAQFIEQGSVADINSRCVEAIKPLPIVLGANSRPASASSSSSAAQALDNESSSSSATGSVQP